MTYPRVALRMKRPRTRWIQTGLRSTCQQCKKMRLRTEFWEVTLVDHPEDPGTRWWTIEHPPVLRFCKACTSQVELCSIDSWRDRWERTHGQTIDEAEASWRRDAYGEDAEEDDL